MMKLYFKKDGTLDMRYKSSKDYLEKADHPNNSQSSVPKSNETPESPSKTQSPKRHSSQNTIKERSVDDTTSLSSPFESPLSSPVISREKDDSSSTYISPVLSLASTEIYNSSDIRLNQNGTIDRSSKAVKSGDILFNQDGTVDKRSKAVIAGRLFLDSNGNPDIKVHTDLEIPKNPGDHKTTVYRDRYQQTKFRKETNCPQDYDASHIVDLELAREILKSKPGRHPTEAELRQAMKPLNKLLEARPKSINRLNKENPDNDRSMAQRIIKIIHGENVIRTRLLDQKLVQMKEALHSIPENELNSQIKFVMKEIDRIAPDA